MKKTILTVIFLTSTLTMAATQTIKNSHTTDKNNAELRTALLNLNNEKNILSNLGENKNTDLIEEQAQNNVNNGLNNLKMINN